MHRNYHKRQQIPGHAAFELLVGGIQLVDADARQGQADSGARFAFRERDLVAVGARGPPAFDAEASPDEQEQERAADDCTENPFASAGLHRDETSLSGEHNAEDQQHESAADVDHELHRADEFGAGQEEQAGGRAEAQRQVKRHADDVAGQQHGRPKAAGGEREHQKQERMPIERGQEEHLFHLLGGKRGGSESGYRRPLPLEEGWGEGGSCRSFTDALTRLAALATLSHGERGLGQHPVLAGFGERTAESCRRADRGTKGRHTPSRASRRQSRTRPAARNI